MKTIAFFNNKGGVGKTTLVYHVAWMLAEMGYVVLAADFDPQANLTSMFLDEKDLEKLWTDEPLADDVQTVYQAVDALKRGVGDISPLEPRAVNRREGLYLLPGDLALSDFESDLSEQWPKCVDPGRTGVSRYQLVLTRRSDIGRPHQRRRRHHRRRPQPRRHQPDRADRL